MNDDNSIDEFLEKLMVKASWKVKTKGKEKWFYEWCACIHIYIWNSVNHREGDMRIYLEWKFFCDHIIATSHSLIRHMEEQISRKGPRESFDQWAWTNERKNGGVWKWDLLVNRQFIVGICERISWRSSDQSYN